MLSPMFALTSALLMGNGALAIEVDAGYDVFAAAQVMVAKASYSWEWGTAAEALLELYNPDMSVFGADPFPGGQVPKADPGTFALAYAKQYINLHSQVLTGNSAAGDSASLGVSAILLGQSDSDYLDAAENEATYLLQDVPRWSNGAISHRPDIAELWADNMAMSFPFLAYQAVSTNDPSLMTQTVQQCGLYRDVLQSGQLWQHIVGPQSPDAGHWSTGNGWAAYGMVRVLHTLQGWSGSSGMTSQATQLKTWIKEILDGAIGAGTSNQLLKNYLDDSSWFGEISGTSLLSAVAYRMAVNDPGMFPQSYVSWADGNRKALAQDQNGGVFSPAVDPYNWFDRATYDDGSPEGQAFAVYLYTAYRDCVAKGVCSGSAPPATTISKSGIGPFDILTVLNAPVTFAAMPAPTGVACGAPQSCDAAGCAGKFAGLVEHPTCTGGFLQGCQCVPTGDTCGSHQSCDLNGCAGSFDGLVEFAQCTSNFKGCNCTATSNTCGSHQSCDLNGCAGTFDGLGLIEYPQCSGNFKGCNCTATPDTCGSHQSCDLNGCAGSFDGLGAVAYPQCMENFKGCNCTVTQATCGDHQSCDLNGCAGTFNGLGLVQYPQCSESFVGCNCTATSGTCGNHESCDLNGCSGTFDLSDGKAYCRGNFEGCQCLATGHTCGNRQSCDLDSCAGKFSGSVRYPQCTNFFQGCQCTATSNTCGASQSCGLNDCDGAFNLADGNAYCTNNFVGCGCTATKGTCGTPQSCDLDNCAGKFSGNVPLPTCSNFFKGCECVATSDTCGAKQSCDLNGCAGAFGTDGVPRCQGNFQGCNCTSTTNTCGAPQNCDLNGCAGTFDSSSNTARCRGKFAGCVCNPVASTCGTEQSCDLNGCNGGTASNGNFVCHGNFFGCPCLPQADDYPPSTTIVTATTAPLPSTPTAAWPPPLENPWYCVGVYDENDCNFGGCTHDYSLGARDQTQGKTETSEETGVEHSTRDLCGATIGPAVVVCYGDITQECSDYDVARYNGRTCRTNCPSAGDANYCVDIFEGEFGYSLTQDLICDRAIP